MSGFFHIIDVGFRIFTDILVVLVILTFLVVAFLYWCVDFSK